jgi:hypothetical protein
MSHGSKHDDVKEHGGQPKELPEAATGIDFKVIGI